MASTRRLPGLASLVGGTPPPALVAGLRAIADHVSAAQKHSTSTARSRPLLRFSPVSTRCERSGSSLRTMGLSDEARFNLDARLKTKEDQFTEAALLAHGLRIEVLSDDGIVVPGQDVRVSISIGDRGRPVSVSSVGLDWVFGPGEVSVDAAGGWRRLSVRRGDTDSSRRQGHQAILEAAARQRRDTSSSRTRRSGFRSARRRSARRSR